MQSFSKKLINYAYILFLSGSLIACGGGDSDENRENKHSTFPYSEPVECTSNVTTACSIEPNTKFKGALGTPSDKDWWKFTIPDDGSFTIETDNYGIDLFCVLYDENGVMLESDDNSGEASNCKISNLGVVGDTTYYAEISSSTTTFGDYSGLLTFNDYFIPVKINNSSLEPISSMYSRKLGETLWSDNLLSEPIPKGTSRSFDGYECNMEWEFRLVSTDESTEWVFSLNLTPCESTFSATLL